MKLLLKIVGLVFWNQNNVLFYIKKTYKYVNRPNVLGNFAKRFLCGFLQFYVGETYNDYLAVNRNISNYSNNMISFNDENIPEEIKYKETTQHSKLFHKHKLLSFELLVKCTDTPFTIFEDSVKSLLNLEIHTLEANCKKLVNKEDIFFDRYKGFKVSNSHFRIGSKIHIRDFYYAKRLFYNSFYANRFAFIIANYISTSINNQTKKITLVGYSYYSELLVSNIRKLLNDRGYKKYKS